MRARRLRGGRARCCHGPGSVCSFPPLAPGPVVDRNGTIVAKTGQNRVVAVIQARIRSRWCSVGFVDGGRAAPDAKPRRGLQPPDDPPETNEAPGIPDFGYRGSPARHPRPVGRRWSTGSGGPPAQRTLDRVARRVQVSETGKGASCVENQALRSVGVGTGSCSVPLVARVWPRSMYALPASSCRLGR